VKVWVCTVRLKIAGKNITDVNVLQYGQLGNMVRATRERERIQTSKSQKGLGLG
jgi:hypothetical protein